MALTIYQSRIGTGTAGREVLLDCQQAPSIRHEFVSQALPEDQPLQSDFHTPSGYQRPVGRFQLALWLAQSISLELAPALPEDQPLHSEFHTPSGN